MIAEKIGAHLSVTDKAGAYVQILTDLRKFPEARSGDRAPIGGTNVDGLRLCYPLTDQSFMDVFAITIQCESEKCLRTYPRQS